MLETEKRGWKLDNFIKIVEKMIDAETKRRS